MGRPETGLTMEGGTGPWRTRRLGRSGVASRRDRAPATTTMMNLNVRLQHHFWPMTRRHPRRTAATSWLTILRIEAGRKAKHKPAARRGPRETQHQRPSTRTSALTVREHPSCGCEPTARKNLPLKAIYPQASRVSERGDDGTQKFVNNLLLRLAVCRGKGQPAISCRHRADS